MNLIYGLNKSIIDTISFSSLYKFLEYTPIPTLHKSLLRKQSPSKSHPTSGLHRHQRIDSFHEQHSSQKITH